MPDMPVPEITSGAASDQRLRCPWCDDPFVPRGDGGKRQRFCTARCRKKFHSAARRWAENEIMAGRLTVADLRTHVGV